MNAPLEPLIYDISRPGRIAFSLPDLDVPEAPIPAEFERDPELLGLPEVSELDVVRHFTHLSRLNHAIDVGFYPLGSCTMKYNPKLNEDVARMPGFTWVHPLQPEDTVQGALRVQYELQNYLAEIAGFDAATLQPAAGAQGELVGVLTIRAYHQARGDTQRNKILVPDAAHGTNPATAAMCGFKVVTIKSDSRGNVDLEALARHVGPDTAGLMLTNPNTLGLFDEHLTEIAEIVHKAGGLMYGDGANFNAILGIVKPGEVGFDVMHINLHKTFSTPHGGGGPGSGPVVCKSHLAPYLPTPVVEKETRDGQDHYSFRKLPGTVGKVRSFWGNFGMHVRAYTYIRVHGARGLRDISENAVLNANYIMNKLKDTYDVAYDRTCMHECVLSGRKQKQKYGVKTLDIAKRLLDFGYHSPTIYFPLIVEEAIMIEPTETESKTTLDEFIDTMLQIAREAEETPDLVKNAPYTTPVLRLDEATAARKPELRYRCFG